MPEDPNVEQQAQEAPQAPPASDPWQPWQQAGFAPDQNVHEVRQAYDWVKAITDENRHELELERTLREWNHLPDGVSFAEMKAAAQQIAAQRQDPFGQQQQPQQPQYPQQNGYQTPDYGDPYAAQPQQPTFDPQQLRQGVEQIVEQRMAAERQQLEQQLAVRDLNNSLQQQLASVAQAEGLTDEERQTVWQWAVNQLNTGQVPQERLGTVMQDAWGHLSSFAQARMARTIQAQNGAPRTMTPTGATPGSAPVPQGLSNIADVMRAHGWTKGE